MNVRPYFVRKADWHSDRTAIRRVRLDVFVHEQHTPEKFEGDGLDESCLHALAPDAGDSPIGTGRLLDNGQISRMAVLASWRGTGGRSACIWSCSMFPARPSADHSLIYERYGSRLKAQGGKFMDANIPHRHMILDFRTAPP